ncbi:fibrinogen C domain-containing protein 1-like [Actinia tenebrosa]|uniref:Fibrinogen C domain-containing protein 1-like n=1 Tax=Actinia tenebrosa TaxID=6105 RepID=A0A6P8HTW8_ACTTE|nr:fibrinogen C domain-containing protein 1-like [Actinia tenebrosa]
MPDSKRSPWPSSSSMIIIMIFVLLCLGDLEVQARRHQNQKDFKDCSEIYKSGERRSGVYTVNPYGSGGPFEVYCDMTTDGGGWTMFQRRQDGSVDFYRTWDEYKTGFGNLTGEFWLGNEKIHRLTSRPARWHPMLRVDLEDWDGAKVYAKYGSFMIRSESQKYTMNILANLYSGTASDSLALYHRNLPFTTKDRDNDKHCLTNCARKHSGAWWYSYCYASNLNGKYLGNATGGEGVVWWYYKNDNRSLKFSEMKLKPH